ncbi:MAG: YraN family protein [Crocinitomicaceae bacterium]
MSKHLELGREGEALAVKHLEENGFHILDRNYRFKHLELDIVCEKDNTLVIVEVKTRTTRKLGEPYMISRAKQKQILKATTHYVQERGVDSEIRLDVIGIIKNQFEVSLEHIEGAFVG